MLSSFELALLALTVTILLYSGAWTDRKFRRFDKIPAHYDLRGQATRLTSRRPMAWLIPIMFSVMLMAFAAMLTLIPSEYINGDPKAAFWIILFTLPTAQALILWLLSRWAARQG